MLKIVRLEIFVAITHERPSSNSRRPCLCLVLALLIFNFTLVEDEKSKDQAKAWASRIGTWSFMRDGYEDFETDYFEHVQQNLADYYSDFVTRFVVEFAGLLIPWWRVAILPGAKSEYYANSE